LLRGVKIEADLSTLAVQTQALVEGMTAFSEKRQPGFRQSVKGR
jgi:1,4-dihydroxy-2-naphthoyl-CoA synthase